jgi:hypothetical protein
MVLPFVVITDCQTHEATRYFGIEVFVRSGGWMFVASLVAAGILYAPVAEDRALGDAARALAVAIGGLLTLVSTGLLSLFDHVEPLVGAWLSGIGWSGLWLLTVSSAVPAVWKERGRPDPLLYVVMLFPHLIGILASLPTEDPVGILGSAGTGALLLVPFLLLGTTASRRTDPGARAITRALFALSACIDGGMAFAMHEGFPLLALLALVGLGLSLFRVFVPRAE